MAERVAALVNWRLDPGDDPVNTFEIIKHFGLERLSDHNVALMNLINEELKVYPPGEFINPEKAWEEGISFEWRVESSHKTQRSREEEEGDPIEAIAQNPLALRLATPTHDAEAQETVAVLSIVISLDTVALAGPGFPEFVQLKRRLVPILDQLGVKLDMRTLPARPPREAGVHIWCMANVTFSTKEKPTETAIEYAISQLGAGREELE